MSASTLKPLERLSSEWEAEDPLGAIVGEVQGSEHICRLHISIPREQRVCSLMCLTGRSQTMRNLRANSPGKIIAVRMYSRRLRQNGLVTSIRDDIFLSLLFLEKIREKTKQNYLISPQCPLYTTANLANWRVTDTSFDDSNRTQPFIYGSISYHISPPASRVALCSIVPSAL